MSAEQLAQSCIQQLENALGRPPAELGEEVDRVERELAVLRDRLIERLRATADVAAGARQRAVPEQVNAALSLVVGVEYPARGIQRQLLEQACNALKPLLASGDLAQACVDAPSRRLG